MLNELQKHMPQRTLKLSSAGDGGLIKQITMGCIGILIAGGLAYCVFFMGQAILKDRKMIDNSVSVPTAQISPDSECSSNKFISDCDVKINHNGQTIERSFSFVDFSSDDYSVEVIAQKDDPSNMNVDLAIDKMNNRIMTVGGIAFIALMALIWAVITFRAIPNKQRLKKLMNAPESQPWEFVAIPATIDTDEVTYTTEIDGNSVELDISSQGRKPIILGEQDDTSLVLGIKAKSQNTTVVLCEKLKNINFTKTEKKPLLDIIKSL